MGNDSMIGVDLLVRGTFVVVAGFLALLALAGLGVGVAGIVIHNVAMIAAGWTVFGMAFVAVGCAGCCAACTSLCG